MEQNQQNDQEKIPHVSAEFGSVPNNSEGFGTIPKIAEDFRTVPHVAERKQNHTLTVREVARLFEAAGVARTERSIVNWCQPNRTGIARLDSYFDPNERRYYISPQSVQQAIAEEKAKSAKNSDASEPFGNFPPREEKAKKSASTLDDDDSLMKELQHENLDLKITNSAKNMEIERLHKERESFFNQLLSASHKIGELETKLLQIESPSRSQIKVE